VRIRAHACILTIGIVPLRLDRGSPSWRLEAALQDFRDVLVWAEYTHHGRVGGGTVRGGLDDCPTRRGGCW